MKMPDHLGDDMRKVRPEEKEEEIKCLYLLIFLYTAFHSRQIFNAKNRNNNIFESIDSHSFCST